MSETEIASAAFGLIIGASIWVPLLAIQKWNDAGIKRLRAQINAVETRLNARIDQTKTTS